MDRQFNSDIQSGKIVFMVWDAKNDWKVLSVSKSIEPILGYSVEDFKNGVIKYTDLIHPQDLAKVQQEVHFSSQKGKLEFTHEIYRIRYAEGQYRSVYDHTKIIRNDAGEAIEFHGYISDETEILQQKTRLELVLGGTHLGLWDWYPKTDQVFFDERWAEMLGYKLSEIEPSLEAWESRVHPDDIGQCFMDIQAHMAGTTDFYENVHRMMHKDGKWRYILDRGRIVESDMEGNPVRFTGTHTDITALKSIQQALELKKEKYQLLMDNASDAVYLMSMEGRILEASKQSCVMLGYEMDALLKMTVMDLDYDLAPLEFAEIVSSLSSKTVKFEREHRTQSGAVIPVEISAVLIDIHDEKFIYAAVRDMAEIKEKERLLLEMSYLDELTGIKNRKAFIERFHELQALKSRYGSLFSLVLFDLDDFQAINSEYGQVIGDTVLRELTAVVLSDIREADYLFRVGGDAFVILLSETKLSEAINVSNKILKHVQNAMVTVDSEVTISAGVMEVEDDASLDDCYRLAESLLNQSKNAGKNQVASKLATEI